MQDRSGLQVAAGAGAAIAVGGVQVMMTPGYPMAFWIGDSIVLLGCVVLFIASLRLRALDIQRGESPLRVVHDPQCCRFVSSAEQRVFPAVVNSSEYESVEDVEVYVNVSGRRNEQAISLVNRVIGWVGEGETKRRSIAPQGHHHLEFARLANRKCFVRFPFGDHPIPAGDYAVTFSVESKNHKTRRVRATLHCSTVKIEIRNLPEGVAK